MKEESEKVSLKLKIQETKIMASGPITSWQINGETMEMVRDFLLWGFKITADGDCSHEIKRRLLLGRKVRTNLSSCLRKGTPLASRVAQGVSGPSSSCVWNPRVCADDARGWQCPFVLCLHPQACLRRGVRASGPSQELTGESGAFGMWPHPRGSSRNSS